MSPNAPAGTPSRNTGRLVAVWTSATNNGDGAMVVIAHAAPTFCIHVPMFETMEAIQIQRNHVNRSGLHELCAREPAVSDVACAKFHSKIWRLPRGWKR